MSKSRPSTFKKQETGRTEVTVRKNDLSIVGTQEEEEKYSKLICRPTWPNKIGRAHSGKNTDPYQNIYLLRRTKAGQTYAVLIKIGFVLQTLKYSTKLSLPKKPSFQRAKFFPRDLS